MTARRGVPHKLDAAVVDVLREAVPGLIAVYRFGSSASGESRPDSDVDLAVLGHDALAPLTRFDLQERVAALVGRQVDLLDLRVASTVMASQVVTTGVVLYDGEPAARGSFEDYVYGRYARLNEERRGILERIAEEGSVYGR